MQVNGEQLSNGNCVEEAVCHMEIQNVNPVDNTNVTCMEIINSSPMNPDATGVISMEADSVTANSLNLICGLDVNINCLEVRNVTELITMEISDSSKELSVNALFETVVEWKKENLFIEQIDWNNVSEKLVKKEFKTATPERCEALWLNTLTDVEKQFGTSNSLSFQNDSLLSPSETIGSSHA